MTRAKHILVVNTAVFLTVAFLHLLRLAYRAPAVIGDIPIPLWLSGAAAILGLGMAWFNWGALERKGKGAVLRLAFSLVIIDMLVLLYSWAAGLEYWGFSGSAFLWFAILDAAILFALRYVLRGTHEARQFKVEDQEHEPIPMTHYVCTGTCGGESGSPGVCQAERCPCQGQELSPCECSDGGHKEVRDSEEGRGE